MDATVLASVPLFEGLTGAEVARCAERFEEIEVIAGTHLIDQDDHGYKLFIVLDGTVDVFVDGTHVNQLGPNECFGESALLSGARRNASVIAATRVRAARMMVWDFQQMTDEVPSLAARLEAAVAARSTDD